MMRRCLWFCLVVCLGMLTVTDATAQRSISYPPLPEAVQALTSDEAVTVRNIRDWLYVFRPAGTDPDRGVIIYPGAFVEPRSYAPVAREIAARGYVAVIVRMPFDFALLGIRLGNLAMIANRDVASWAIAGHSLGGVAAAEYAATFPRRINGVVFWASYPTASTSLSGAGKTVASVYGTLDGLTTPADIEASLAYLRADALLVPVDGGNHTQFGSYSETGDPGWIQPGDQPATLSPAEQRQAVVDATVWVLEIM